VCHWEKNLRTDGCIYLKYLLRHFKIRGFLFTHVIPAVATPPAVTVSNSAFPQLTTFHVFSVIFTAIVKRFADTTNWLDSDILSSAPFWVITQQLVVISYRRFRTPGLLTLEDLTDRLPRNVGKKVPPLAA
jgi:hypothetical protein